MRLKSGVGIFIITVSTATLVSLANAAEEPNPKHAVRDISDMKVDKQQLRHAVASRTLTWLTGSSSNNDYVSVGRLANFFGFIGLRVASGHSLSRGKVAKETLLVLKPKQRTALIDLVQNQKDSFQDVHVTRHEMNRALEGLLVGEEISREAFLELGRAYGAAEAELGRVIGQRLGNVSQSLSPKQTAKLQDIRQRHITGQSTGLKIRGIKTKLSKEDKKELVNIAARFLSWTTGDKTFNDFEVVGKPSQHFGFVSLRIESNHGIKRSAVAKEVWELLSLEQHQALDAAADHNANIFENFINTRAQLMRTLEVALEGKTIDSADVKDLGRQIGALEAEMTWAQAMAMLSVRKTMSEEQRTALLDMRAKYTGKRTSTLPQDPVTRGRQLYAQCSLCHSDTNASVMAPDLSNIVGGNIAGDVSFGNYSDAIKTYAAKDGVWSEARLNAFLQSPRTYLPGTYMGYDGLDHAQDRDALIAYLKTRD